MATRHYEGRDRQYGIGRFEQQQLNPPRDDRGRFTGEDDDDDRGWFDRVRDTASRWLRRDDDPDRDRDRDDDDDRRGWNARYQDRDEHGRFVDDDDHRYGMRNPRYQQRDDRGRFIDDEYRELSQRGNRGWQGGVRDMGDDRYMQRDGRYMQRDDRYMQRDDRYTQRGNRYMQGGDRYMQGGDRSQYRTGSDRDRFMRSWQDDDNRGRYRSDDDNRARQFASYGRDDDDRSGQFNRIRDDHRTLGRRGDIGPSGRTPYDRYDDRGRFSHVADDDHRRFERGGRGFQRGTSGIGSEFPSRDNRDRYHDRYDMRGDRSQYRGGRDEREYDYDMQRGSRSRR